MKVGEEKLISEARKLLNKNWRQGKNFAYTCPSIVFKYPHQWLWDSCFHVIVNSRLDTEKAELEFKTLLSGQNDNGSIPMTIMWKPLWLSDYPSTRFFFVGKSSRLTQPPAIAIALEKLYEKTENKNFLGRMLPKVKKYYQWLASERDPDNDRLVSVIHPWESGTDASPSYDWLLFKHRENRPSYKEIYFAFYKLLWKYFRMGWKIDDILSAEYFNVEDVFFNCIYALGLRSLSRLLKEINDPDYGNIKNLAYEVEAAILTNCWDKEAGLFFSVSHHNGKHYHLKSNTLASIMPIVLETIPKTTVEHLISRHLLNPDEYWLPYPLPFVAKYERYFDPMDRRILWRGPTWINTNWFMIRGLNRHGQSDLASHIAKMSIELVEKNGFYEFFNSVTGKAEGQNYYSWTTLVLEMFDYI